MRFLIAILLTLTMLSAKNRIALLIGNSKYSHLDKLYSPRQDIPNLAQKLRDIGFDVEELYNLDEKSMKKAIKAFKIKLLKNPNAIALFYYSGHGSQAYGESYLIPTDGDTRDQADVDADGIKVEWIAQKMATANTKANILFLDACRDVPIGAMGGTKGLGQVKRQPSSTLILYSTSKNRTASDDRVFNRIVLNKIALNQPFISVANDISYAVRQKTGGEQVPELLSTGLPNIILAGRYTPPTPTPQPTSKTHSMKGITIVDGLMYQNQPFSKQDKINYYNQKEGGRVWTWNGAKKYCRDLTLGGYSDWRLPTREELMKLGNIELNHGDGYADWKKWFNKNKHRRNKNSKNHYHFIKKEFIENMPESSWFWSSTEKDSSDSWGVHFNGGNGYWSNKSDKGYVLCVR